jgi:hypothetical protein
MWLPAVVAAAASLLLLVGVLLAGIGRRGGEDDPDGESDGGGGGGRRRPPPPEAPRGTGPVDWPEFERQFADFVARGRQAPAAARERRPEEVGAGPDLAR